jgi:hypothetical protein
MTYAEVKEAVGFVTKLSQWLLAAVPSNIGLQGAVARRAAGDLVANAEVYIRNGGLSVPILNVFNQVQIAGATFDGMDMVRGSIDAYVPVYLVTQLIQDAGLRFSMSQLGRILTNLTFVSRDDADRYLNRILDAFYPIIEDVANGDDVGTYQALIALQAAIVYDITVRGRLLPRIISYEFAINYPAHAMAQRIYPDACLPGADTTTSQRAYQLVTENKVIHPAFMPVSGIALSD